jgi:hypothetical protein
MVERTPADEHPASVHILCQRIEASFNFAALSFQPRTLREDDDLLGKQQKAQSSKVYRNNVVHIIIK